MLKRLLIFITILLFVDVYLFIAYKSFLNNSTHKIIFKWFYGLSMLISYGCFALLLFTWFGHLHRPVNSSTFINLCFGYTFTFIILKVVLLVFAAIDDIIRLIQLIVRLFGMLFQHSSELNIPSRRKFIGQLGLGIASIPFASMLYGITKGKYNYKIKKVALKLENLPKAFDGFKVTHISDIHAGSFDSIDDVKRGVDMIQNLNSDLILFTGDFINEDADELNPYLQLFKTLKAPFGKYSSLGNHDYGTHKQWKSNEEKRLNFEKLKVHQKEMDFHLLNNESIRLEKGNENIQIVGVENWGKPPFPQKGDLDKALEKVGDEDFKILLSHDPSHWDLKVIPHQKNIDLTLSGHTHGMQFGIEIPGLKWSPSKYIYKQWAGLYKNNNQYLYVNRGFGFLGFPGRVGIWPEITEITLNKA